jgi:hypothetical protein
MRRISRNLLLLAVAGVIQPGFAAAPSVSYDGRTLSLAAENQSFGQVMELLQQKTGLQFEIPGELQSLRLPLVEIKGLSVRESLLKLLEGSNHDYILIAAPGNAEQVLKLLVPGKSSKVSVASSAFRAMSRPVEDPFGGGVETSFEDTSAMPLEQPVINAQPVQGPAAQGIFQQGVQPGVQPGLQPGVQPVPVNPTQPFAPPGVVFPQQQQQQNQPQGLQPFSPFGNQNNRRSPY